MSAVQGAVCFNATTSGTGDFVVLSAPPGCVVPEAANVTNAKTYLYYAQSIDGTQWESGGGVYTILSHKLARTTINANSDGTGVSTLVFEPPLRASPANAALITIASPKFTGLLVDDDQDQYTASTRVQTLEDGGFSVKFQEAFS